MILSIDSRNDKVKITSVMRDSFVPIGDSYGKINSAYSKGGPTLAVRTLNTIFGLDIRDYATVNFFGMEDIIDAVLDFVCSETAAGRPIEYKKDDRIIVKDLKERRK
jgi:anionic cell wall polymer biosynthesis LytR-Cps2A-Psr (LCP) family protein